MLSSLKSLFGAPRVAPSQIGRLTYAIGDIHGRDDLFAKMIERIRQDCLVAGEKPLIILLGDYVDRGPASRQVLDRIIALRESDWCDLEILMGNHEEAVLRFMREAGYGVAWAEYGGAATLASYGVAMPHLRSDPAAWDEVRNNFAVALPKEHLRLLAEMKFMLQIDDYLFVHAGVMPDRPLADQGPEIFLWVRGAFLSAEKACEYVVVHGHTPQDDPSDTRWRIGVDTGAYATGVLTGVRLQGEARSLLQVR